MTMQTTTGQTATQPNIVQFPNQRPAPQQSYTPQNLLAETTRLLEELEHEERKDRFNEFEKRIEKLEVALEFIQGTVAFEGMGNRS